MEVGAQGEEKIYMCRCINFHVSESAKMSGLLFCFLLFLSLLIAVSSDVNFIEQFPLAEDLYEIVTVIAQGKC